MEGLFLRGRTLRFADCESRLYAPERALEAVRLQGTNLGWAQLQGADVVLAKLQGADLARALLHDANLAWAQLQMANIEWAQLQGASLYLAQLQGAYLAGAHLQRADLRGAVLHGAYLEVADLQAANLVEAQLQAADLWRAVLRGSDLWRARMQGVRLLGAQMQGADLRCAQLEGSIMVGTQLQGADLRGVQLWRTAFSPKTDPSFADLRGSSWQPPDENEKAQLRDIVDAVPVREDWQKDSKERLERLIGPGALPDEPPAFALDGPLLVDNVNDPRWRRLDRTRLTTDERAYDEALVPFLADLARSDANIAHGLASRVGEDEPSRAARLARGLLDRAGPALPEEIRKRLSSMLRPPRSRNHNALSGSGCQAVPAPRECC